MDIIQALEDQGLVKKESIDESVFDALIQGVSKVEVNSKWCTNGHPMIVIPAGGQAYPTAGVVQYCDACKKSDLHEMNEINYHCSVCHYDLCNQCANKTCINGHPMSVIPAGALAYSTGTQNCDACRKGDLHETNEANYHCSVCQYDLCNQCANRSVLRVADSFRGIHVVIILDESIRMNESLQELREAYGGFIRQRQDKKMQ